MASRYWVGGTANWDGTAGTKWASTSGGAGGQTVPTTADDVFFDANSGANTVTISTGNTGCKSLTCTGFTGTLTGTAGLTIAGGFTLVSGMTFSATGFWVISGSGTLTSAGKLLPPLVINVNPGTVNQGDAFTFNGSPSVNSGCIALGGGTYNTNNYNITANYTGGNSGGGIDVNYSANARTLNLGSSTISITINSNNNINYFNCTSTTNLTFNAGTSTYICNNTGGSAISAFAGNGLTFSTVQFLNTSTDGTVIPITGANTFTNLTFLSRTVAGVGNYTLSANQTITGTLTTTAGTDPSMRSFIKSNTAGTARTLTCASVSLTDADFQDITIAGAASPASGTRIGDCIGNTNITFPVAKSVYWNLAGAQNFNAVGWATSSGGTPASANFPLAQDTVVFDNTGSVTGTITVNGAWNLGTVDMSARTSAMTLAFSKSQTIFGNWINGTTTISGGNNFLTFSNRGSQSITGNGRTFSSLGFILDSINGTLTLQDAITQSAGVAYGLTLTNGTLNLNGKTFTLASSRFTTGTGTKNLTFNGGTLTLTGNISDVFSNAVPTGFTTTAGTGTGTISLTSSAAKGFVGGGSTFNCNLNQGGAGALTVSGSNTFNDITNTYSATGATTITFTIGTTQTVNNFSATGTSGKVLTINSSSAGSQATLSKASGTVNVNYLSVKDSNATGGAAWYAGGNSTNVSNNTGWIFGSPGYFFLLF